MTDLEALGILDRLYGIACRRIGEYVYIEILEEVHTTIKGIMLGADPADSLKDLQSVLERSADGCASNKARMIFEGWAQHVYEAARSVKVTP